MKKIISFILILTMTVLAVGCGKKKKVPDTPETLEIYVFDAGYGNQWLYDLASDFKTIDWVKAKYPNVNIEISHNAVANYGADKIQSGKKANSIDLVFGQYLFSMFNKRDASGQTYLEPLNELYDTTVPGEQVKYGDKLLDCFKSGIDVNGNTVYYSTPWAAGFNGIFYNETLFNTLDMELPVTTDEFIAVLDKAKSLSGNKNGKYDLGYSIMSCTKTSYWRFMFTTWWAQYEGLTEYSNFYNGIYDGALSNKVFTQLGRLESLKVLDKILTPANGYVYPSANAVEFMQAQNNFLCSNGLFQCNGDWYSREMDKNWTGFKQYGYNDTLKTLRSPIISAIINNLPDSSVEDDEELAKIVRAIDEGKVYSAYNVGDNVGTVTEDDYNRIVEARTVVDSIGINHTAVIPSYATAKDLAKDFLLYMATDRAQVIYIQSTLGGTLPFGYDLKNKSPEVYSQLDTLQQTKFDIYNNATFGINVLPSPNSFKLVYFGGLSALTMSGNLETSIATNKSGESLYYNDIERWNNDVWNNLLVNAGV